MSIFSEVGKAFKTVTKPVSNIPVVSNVLDATLKVAGNLVDESGRVISQAGDVAEKAGQDIVSEAGRAGKKVEKVAQSANKELHKAVSPTTEFISNYGKGLEKSISSAAKGDFKGVAKAQLGALDATKKYIIDGSIGNVRAATNVLREAGKSVGYKDLQNFSNNINREYEKGAEIYGPIILDIAANILTSGGYGLANQAYKSVADEGVSGLFNEDFLKEAALVAAQNYLKSDSFKELANSSEYAEYAKYATPENLKAMQKVAEGDAEGAAYAKAGADPELAKGLRKIITEGVDAKDALKQVLANTIASKTGFSNDFANKLISGNISSIAKAGVGEAAGKFLPDDYAKIAKQLATKKPNQIASEYAASYLGIDPSVLGMANKVIKDPRGEAMKALGSYANIVPDAVQSIRSGIGSMSGDLQASALQAAGNSIGLHPADLEMARQISGNSFKGAPFQALSKTLGIDPAYLQMGQDMYRGKTDFNAPTLDSFENMPVAEIKDAVDQQTEQIQQKTNDIKSKKSGKKVADLFDKTPGLARQFFWNT